MPIRRDTSTSKSPPITIAGKWLGDLNLHHMLADLNLHLYLNHEHLHILVLEVDLHMLQRHHDLMHQQRHHHNHGASVDTCSFHLQPPVAWIGHKGPSIQVLSATVLTGHLPCKYCRQPTMTPGRNWHRSQVPVPALPCAIHHLNHSNLATLSHLHLHIKMHDLL